MSREPRRYFDFNDEDRELSEKYFAHDSDQWANVHSVRVLIAELVNRLPGPYINREILAERLLTIVLRDNHDYELISTQVKEGQALDALTTLCNVATVVKSTQNDIRTILDDADRQHSGHSLREQSDEILKWIDTHPYPFDKTCILTQGKNAWFQQNMPAILQYLKETSQCSNICPQRNVWPPAEENTSEGTNEELEDAREASLNTVKDFATLSTAKVALKNAILAYHHNISTKTLRNYLQGHLPKISRSASSSS